MGLRPHIAHRPTRQGLGRGGGQRLDRREHEGRLEDNLSTGREITVSILPMKQTIPLILSVTMLGLVSSTRADVLELKSGSVLNGKYVGGTAGTVRFETSAGVQ